MKTPSRLLMGQGSGRRTSTSKAVVLIVLLLELRVLAAAAPLQPMVEIEEEVYSHEPAKNGAGPMWCSGSTCLVRVGAELFASGLETLAEVPPLNNCRWTLFHRTDAGWRLVRADPADRTREPAPLAVWPDGRVFLSANPTLTPKNSAGGGPAEPRLLEFTASNPAAPYRTLLPGWKGRPKFTEHSYRSLATDGLHRELILFQNVDYTHAEWSFLDRTGEWSHGGRLVWPWGADYAKPQPIRVCYPNVALKNRAVYFCGVSDIQEPNPAWREFKRQLTGQEWDYDFRRLFFTWSEDIGTGQFNDWIEIASREATAGWISPGDLWVDANDVVHLVWAERALDVRLREKFFPGTRQSHALNYARVRRGKIVLRRTLLEAGEGGEIPSAARFHVTTDQRLIVFYYVRGTSAEGRPVSENRVLEINAEGAASSPVRVPLKTPFSAVFTPTIRAGCAPADALEILGLQQHKPHTLSYARLRLW